MQFTSTLLFAASALVASVSAANVVHFHNQDSTTRTIYFANNPGMENIEAVTISGLNTIKNVTFPEGWTGNWYSVSEGAANVTGMLGEVMFGGYGGATFFDISAIVNPDDDQGVKILKPLSADTPLSGCQTFPCSNAYNQPDDIATLATDDTELICLLGTLTSSKRSTRQKRFDHEFVTGAL
ncbi:hypothetical protein BP6252_00255 [Coleophoma cylindrospora]|uniref:DNase1 protein n=1 Tax=Coleophoma cylindrospora TaxID=1849047 RepID=A0A3D8SPG7_9HELO|nr:hypothetical protein BP6252_00255 [Coleophoma cylindrospora]